MSKHQTKLILGLMDRLGDLMDKELDYFFKERNEDLTKFTPLSEEDIKKKSQVKKEISKTIEALQDKLPIAIDHSKCYNESLNI
jgi:hypothetical protein